MLYSKTRLLVPLLASLGTTYAATFAELQANLQALKNVLVFQGSVYDTYSPILDKALEAYDAVASIEELVIPYSRAKNIRQRLDHLLVESRYFVGESAQPGYEPGALESHTYVTANVDEWRYTVNYMINNIQEPFCDVELQTPQEDDHKNISIKADIGTEFRDSHWTPIMVVVPPGSYVAGSSKEEQDRWGVDDNRRAFELPKRQVTISKPLAFGKTEITVAQFSEFLDNSCYQMRNGARWWNPANVSQFIFNERLSWRHPGFPQVSESPVVAITRYDAQAYAKWLSAKTGASYRLPNEDEWEWAARGGATTSFFWGDDLDQASIYANTYDDSAHAVNQFQWPSNNLTDGFPWTAPVASFKPNAFGLYDVTANAREFVEDDWNPYLAGTANDGSAHDGPAPFPTVRGGAWNYNPKNLRLNYRSAYLSSEVATNMFGFRLVRDL